jgi:antitoxin HicB
MTKTIPKYLIHVFWSDEDEGFIATVPDLPGCSAFGRTKSDAVNEIEPAIQAWIEAARAAGNPIPKPSPPPNEARLGAGRVRRMPETAH